MADTALLTNQYGTQDQQPNSTTSTGPLNLSPIQQVQQTQPAQAPTLAS